ncbi:hypothetical protein EDD15DRAFT_2198064 [Pisolithus albus]|nr:hypothetical protein EDD15DRAFT_2198064 [Pisolithus albus]
MCHKVSYSEKKDPTTLSLMDSPTKAKLDLLRLYLKNLPNSIPFVDSGSPSQYGFDFFVVDDEDMEDKGPVGAINRQLEIRLGHWNNGPILFTEQGPSLCKLTDLFEEWFGHLSSDPEIPILHKWLDDLITAAENAYSSTNTKLPEVMLDRAVNAPPADIPVICSTKRPRLGKSDTKILSNEIDPAYTDLPEVEHTRNGGWNWPCPHQMHWEPGLPPDMGYTPKPATDPWPLGKVYLH